MATVEIELNNNADSFKADPKAWTKSPKSYRCHISLVKEDDGSYSAVVLNLPGAGSCGDTEVEAISNAREAVSGVIESYLKAGGTIPWVDSLTPDIPDSVEQTWILVHV